MMIEVLKSKLHCVQVTQANLNYMGSITIDEDLMVKANEYQDAAPADSTRLGHTEYGHNPDKAHIADEWVYIYAEDPASKYPNTIDVTGGWYDAGDHGKYVVNGGVSLWTLMNIFQ